MTETKSLYPHTTSSRFALAGIMLIALALASATADAQTTAPVSANEPAPVNPARVMPAVVPPIMLGRMLVAGQGMALLELGTHFAQVMSNFGPPLDTRKTGLLGKVLHWYYTADDGTNIIVSGEDETVDSISLRGPTDSTFMTIEGLTFGMEHTQIATLYGRPEVDQKQQGLLFDYPTQGISFVVNDGLISEIVIKRPEPAN